MMTANMMMICSDNHNTYRIAVKRRRPAHDGLQYTGVRKQFVR